MGSRAEMTVGLIVKLALGITILMVLLFILYNNFAKPVGQATDCAYCPTGDGQTCAQLADARSDANILQPGLTKCGPNNNRPCCIKIS
ncbi:hypothetical protein HQ545_08420 [Candidatus Woesearchaeota archaeon]|nr:hypothetical protein [Candidatus Woesearchaeota archaeon]